MKIRHRLTRFFERNERDFNRLMEIIEKEDALFDSPALSILYTPYSLRKRRKAMTVPEKGLMGPAAFHNDPQEAETGRRVLAGHAV